MLLNFQTMICDLTGMQMSNASLLDEGSAAAESLSMCHALHPEGHAAYFVDAEIHPSTLAVVRSRASVLGIAVHVGDPAVFDFVAQPVSGALVQLPGTSGRVRADAAAVVARIKQVRWRCLCGFCLSYALALSLELWWWAPAICWR